MTTGGFITLLVLLTIGAIIFIEIAGMPGRNARERNHPSAEAIALLGWLGLFFGGVPWLVAMVWARMDPIDVSIAPKRTEPEPAAPESTDEE